jgi:iron(II)-dependent oxidoreductase
MGDDRGCLARDEPAHVVDLDAYYIAKFEVTNREWKKFRDDPGYDDPKFWPNGRVCRAIRFRIGRKLTTTAAAHPAPTTTR